MGRTLLLLALVVYASASAGAPRGDDTSPSPSSAEPAATATPAAVCLFCRAPRGPDEFCARCGRLVGTASTGAANRFWGDVPYVAHFPPHEAPISISAEFSDKGLVRETVSSDSGERYTWTAGKHGPEVEGRVSIGRATKESSLSATIEDTVDGGHIVRREVFADVSGDHYYRKLDYRYSADELLESVQFGTWLYAGTSDWKKKPAAWLKHSVGEIVLIRNNGRLTRVETTVREGKRSLRGEPEYTEPVLRVESVRRTESGAIDRLVPTTTK